MQYFLSSSALERRLIISVHFRLGHEASRLCGVPSRIYLGGRMERRPEFHFADRPHGRDCRCADLGLHS